LARRALAEVRLFIAMDSQNALRPRTAAGHGERDQEKQNPNDADDIRYHGDRTGNVAGVSPDEADSRPYD
jgi:hypothetical protein